MQHCIYCLCSCYRIRRLRSRAETSRRPFATRGRPTATTTATMRTDARPECFPASTTAVSAETAVRPHVAAPRANFTTVSRRASHLGLDQPYFGPGAERGREDLTHVFAVDEVGSDRQVRHDQLRICDAADLQRHLFRCVCFQRSPLPVLQWPSAVTDGAAVRGSSHRADRSGRRRAGQRLGVGPHPPHRLRRPWPPGPNAGDRGAPILPHDEQRHRHR